MNEMPILPMEMYGVKKVFSHDLEIFYIYYLRRFNALATYVSVFVACILIISKLYAWIMTGFVTVFERTIRYTLAEPIFAIIISAYIARMA